MPAENIYLVKPVHGNESYTVKAGTYSYDSQTGQHTFKTGDELIATLYNVSVVKQDAVSSAEAEQQPTT